MVHVRRYMSSGSVVVGERPKSTVVTSRMGIRVSAKEWRVSGKVHESGGIAQFFALYPDQPCLQSGNF